MSTDTTEHVHTDDCNLGAGNEALDVWLAFHDCPGESCWMSKADHPSDDDDDIAEYEANTYREDDGHGYRIEYYHTAVGVVMTRYFDTYRECRGWYGLNGFQDFTVCGSGD